MSIDLGVMGAKVSLMTNGFERGVRVVKSGFTDMGKKALYLNQSLELVSKGFSLIEGTIDNVVAPLYNAGKEFAQLKKSFEEITGSTDAAAKEFEFLHDLADRMGQNFYKLAESYKGISAASRVTALEGQKTRKIFEAVTKATASLGINSEGTAGALNAISQMMSKGKITAEELRQQLGERLYGAFNLMAEAIGVSTQELDKMLQNGEVGIDYLTKFADVLNAKYSGAIDDATRASNKFEEAWMDLKIKLADSEFMETITNSVVNLTNALKDPDVQRNLRDMALNLANVVESMSRLAKYAGLRSIMGTMAQAAELARKDLIDMAEFRKLSFMERQHLVDDILAQQKKLEEPIRYKVPRQPVADKPKGTEKTIEPAGGATEATLAKLQSRLAQVKHEAAAIHLSDFEKEIADAKFQTEELTQEFGKLFDTNPQLRALIDEIERAEIELAKSSAAIQWDEKFKDASGEMSHTLEGLSFEKQIKELNHWDAALADIKRQTAALQERYDTLFDGEIPTGIQTMIDKWHDLSVAQVEAGRTEYVEDAVNDLNQAINDLSFQDQLAGMTAWDASLAEIERSIASLRKLHSETFNGQIPADIDAAIEALANLRRAQLEAAQNEEIRFLMQEQADMMNEVFTVDQPYSWELAEINRQYEEMLAKGGRIAEFADAWKRNAEAIVEYEKTVSNVKEITSSMVSHFTNAFAEFARTGKMSLKGLGQALVQELQMIAAQKTAEALMNATHAGIMALISLAQRDFDAAAKWGNAAAAATAGAAVYAGFITASGISGMAHDGISNIPEDGTWLLKKNERVVDAETNRDLKDYLKSGNGGTKVDMTVNINGGDQSSVEKSLPAMKQMIIEVVSGNIAENGDIRRTINAYR